MINFYATRINQMNFKTILLLILISLSTTTFAQKYVGFEMCKKTSNDKIINFLEKSGATDINIDREAEKFLYINIKAKNYPVANGFVDISVSVTDDVLFGIFIDDKDNKIGLLSIMIEKYGEPNITGRLYGINLYQYNSKDKRISIKGTSNSVDYTCESINQRRIQKYNQGLRKNDTGHPL
jgi:hypothetical protein